MAEELKVQVAQRKTAMGMGCAPMSTVGNMADNWKRFFQSFKLYLRASSLDEESDARKVALFLHLIGERGLEIFNSFQRDDEKITFQELVQLFNSYFVPKANVTYACHMFFTCKQSENETLEEFVTNLRGKSNACNFDKLQDRLIKSMFICNMHSKYNFIRERLLMQDELKLDQALELAKGAVIARSQSESMQREQDTEAIMYMNRSRSQSAHRSQSAGRSQSSKSSYHRQSSGVNHTKCGKCGQIHRHKCPAEHARCHKCNRKGHYQQMCRASRVNYVETETTTSEPESASSNNLFIGHVRSSQSKSEWSVNVCVNGVNVNCILDTGSDANVMSWNVYNSLGIQNKLGECQTKIKSYSGNYIDVIGEQTLNCSLSINSSCVTKPISFIVADVASPTVLGKDTCADLGLVKRVFSVEQPCQSQSSKSTNMSVNKPSHVFLSEPLECKSLSQCQSKVSQKLESDVSLKMSGSQMSNAQSSESNLKAIITKYDNVFNGLGCLPGECNIKVNRDVPPKIDAPRKVPFALYSKLQQELDRMEQMNVITKVTEPTEWVSSLIVVEKKNGQLRVCLDPRNLNQAICRSQYPIPTVDLVRSKMIGAKYFSTLDATSGFWMCRLNEESSYLTTFNTPFGRYRFNRLPFGVSCAPEYFHRVMTESFGDIPGVMVYSDDILVSGSTLNEHNERLKMVFDKALKLNVKFNRVKCSFGVTQVKYLGHVFSGQGVTIDSDKIRAISEMPSPTCTKDLQRFLGMVNYLGPFIDNLAKEVAPLRDLLKKDSVFIWNENYEHIFKRLKSLICHAPVLTHFDVKAPIVVSVDSSSTAVGAVLLQNNHPVYYASKTLTVSQQNMAQIEKELYAIVFACVKFHQFIYGQTITVETDHSPLITLFKKPLAEVPTRLQRMMLRIQLYSLNVIYKKGSLMFIADTLSRAALSETSEDELDNDIVVHVNLLIKSLPVSSERLQWLKNATKSDQDMQIVIKYCRQGWPNAKNQVCPQVQEYWQYRHDLHTEEGLLFRSSSIVIPKEIRSDILKIIHSGHLGVERSKSFARGNVFWPFMSTDIKNLVESCHVCLTHRNSNPPQPLLSHQLPSRPWEKLGIDFMSYKNQTYLVVEDYYSNYIEVSRVSNTSAKVLINTLKPIYSRHGIPVEVVSDNGPPYNSAEFKQFNLVWDIRHITSSPYLPRSNGLAESGVKVVKRIFTKCDESGFDPYLALLQYRNTPRGSLASPAQLLMSRSLRTQLPTVSENLKPKVVRFEEHVKVKKIGQEKAERYYNKKTRPLQELKKGESIYYKKTPDSIWLPGEVKEVCTEPRSYVVGGSDGFVGRRNRQHILLPKARSVSPKLLPVSPKPRSVSPKPKAESTYSTPCLTEDNQDTVQVYSRAGRLIKPPRRLNL